MTELNKTMKAKAVRAIEGVHAAYNEVGGIREIETSLEAKRAAAAKHVYALAVLAAETEKTRPKAIELYGELCAHAESEYKRTHEVENLSDALPTWKVFKSNILTGWRDHGLNPTAFRSEGAFRVAKQKALAKSGVPTLPRARAVPLETPEQVDKALSATVTHDTLRELVSRIVFDLETLKRGNVRQAESILRAAVDQLEPLATAQAA